MTYEEAIKTLKLMQAQVEWDYPMEYAAAIDEAIKALEAQEWVPCKKRLPEKSGQYYVSGGGKVWICEFIIIPTNFTGGWCGGWCNDVANPVVQAWMPKEQPEPYREDTDEQT